MITPITLPDLGCESARFSLWYIQPGERVYTGDRIAEVLIPGLSIDLVAPSAGILRERLVSSGDALTRDCQIGSLEIVS